MTQPKLVAICCERENVARSIRDNWDRAHVVAVVDQNLSPTEIANQLSTLNPDWIADNDGKLTANPNKNHETSENLFDDDALVMLTSGSEGSPKVVVHTRQSVAAASDASNVALGATSDDHWLACLPFGHIGGLGVLLRAQRLNSKVSVCEPRSSTIGNAITDPSITVASMVLRQLSRTNTESLRCVLLGGGPSSNDIAQNVVRTYGMTETCGGVVYDGKPIGDTEIRINNHGFVEVRSSSLFDRYLPDGQSRSEDWFTTGDKGQFVGGNLEILGRATDAIRTGGEDVWPSIVEHCIKQLPEVSDVAVIGVPHPEWGQIVCAVVAHNTRKSDRAILDTIRNHVAQSLPARCVPKVIEFAGELPRTSLGKLQRAQLVDWLNSMKEHP